MQDFKTQTKKVSGLGTAHHGVEHWIHQKFTAIFNIILVLWLIFVICHVSELEFYGAREYLAQPWNAILAALFSVNVFYHAKLGLQTVIEDYVPSRKFRVVSLVLLNILIYVGMACSLYSLVKISL